jgi:hypothetical protein
LRRAIGLKRDTHWTINDRIGSKWISINRAIEESCPQYGKGNIAVNWRTRCRKPAALSNPIFPNAPIG